MAFTLAQIFGSSNDDYNDDEEDDPKNQQEQACLRGVLIV